MSKRFSVCFGALLLAGSVFAQLPGEMFSVHREAILSSRYSVWDGIAFCVGRAETSSEGVDSIGYEKARMLAIRTIDELLMDQADWPNESSIEERRIAWMLLSSKHRFAFSDVSLETVWSEKTGPSQYLSVVAIPVETLSVTNRPSSRELGEAIAQAKKLKHDAMDMAYDPVGASNLVKSYESSAGITNKETAVDLPECNETLSEEGYLGFL